MFINARMLKKLLLCFVSLFVFAGSFAMADAAVGGSEAGLSGASLSPEGYWLVSSKDHHLRSLVKLTVNSDNSLSGSFAAIFYVPGHVWDNICRDCLGQFHGKELTGMTFLWGLKQKRTDSNSWSKGKVFAPDSNKTYAASLSLIDKGNKIRFTGCKLIICSSSNWERVSADSVPAYIAKSKHDLSYYPFSTSRV